MNGDWSAVVRTASGHRPAVSRATDDDRSTRGDVCRSDVCRRDARGGDALGEGNGGEGRHQRHDPDGCAEN